MQSIDIFLNDEKKTIVETSTVAALVKQISLDDAPFAIAINGCFIPKSKYHKTPLHDLDQVEVLRPMQGG